MGNNSKPMVELSHGCTSDIRGSWSGVELAKTSIGAASLGRIRMACSGKEGDRLQGLGDIPSGEFSNHEAISNHPTHGEMRSSSMLQGGNTRDSELHGDVETRLDGFQGSTEEVGMEHDCLSQDGD
nr:hypothetical protein CFP56_05206 [Quercus suber]